MSGGKGRVALYLQDKHPVRDGMNYVRYAEERGFEAVWQAESRLVREATIPLAAFAAVTERIKVGTGVINLWTRNVGLMAATFVTLDDLAPGRGLLGIGGGGGRARRRPRGRPGPRARTGHPVPGTAAPHHEGQRRGSVAARRDRACVDLAGGTGGERH